MIADRGSTSPDNQARRSVTGLFNICAEVSKLRSRQSRGMSDNSGLGAVEGGAEALSRLLEKGYTCSGIRDGGSGQRRVHGQSGDHPADPITDGYRQPNDTRFRDGQRRLGLRDGFEDRNGPE